MFPDISFAVISFPGNTFEKITDIERETQSLSETFTPVTDWSEGQSRVKWTWVVQRTEDVVYNTV